MEHNLANKRHCWHETGNKKVKFPPNDLAVGKSVPFQREYICCICKNKIWRKVIESKPKKRKRK